MDGDCRAGKVGHSASERGLGDVKDGVGATATGRGFGGEGGEVLVGTREVGGGGPDADWERGADVVWLDVARVLERVTIPSGGNPVFSISAALRRAGGNGRTETV